MAARKRSSDDEALLVIETADAPVGETPKRSRRGAIKTPRPCVELSAGLARYLLAILDLYENGKPPTQTALSRKLSVSPPTTSEAVGRLRKLQLVEEGSLDLTMPGTSAALVLRSRRSAARELATGVLGLSDDDAEAEAERLAFSASELLGRSLVAWRAGRQD